MPQQHNRNANMKYMHWENTTITYENADKKYRQWEKNHNTQKDVMPISASAATTYDIWVSQAVNIPSLNKHNTQENTEHRRLENQNQKNSILATTTYDT